MISAWLVSLLAVRMALSRRTVISELSDFALDLHGVDTADGPRHQCATLASTDHANGTMQIQYNGKSYDFQPVPGSEHLELRSLDGKDVTEFTPAFLEEVGSESESVQRSVSIVNSATGIRLEDLYPKALRTVSSKAHKLIPLQGSEIVKMLICKARAEGKSLSLIDASDLKASYMLRTGQTWYESLGMYCYGCNAFRDIKDTQIAPLQFKKWLVEHERGDIVAVRYIRDDFMRWLDQAMARPLLTVAEFVSKLDQVSQQPLLKPEFEAIAIYQAQAGNWNYDPPIDEEMLQMFLQSGEASREEMIAFLKTEQPGVEEAVADFTDIHLNHGLPDVPLPKEEWSLLGMVGGWLSRAKNVACSRCHRK